MRMRPYPFKQRVADRATLCQQLADIRAEMRRHRSADVLRVLEETEINILYQLDRPHVSDFLMPDDEALP